MKDEFIASLVNTTDTTTSPKFKDFYDWFKHKLIEDLSKNRNKEMYANYFLDLFERGFDVRKLVKLPIMTFP